MTLAPPRLAAVRPMLLLFALAAAPGRAQSDGSADAGPPDAGEVPDSGEGAPGIDAGTDPCARRCEGDDVLVYCDVDAPAQIDCIRDLEGSSRCGLLSDSYGEDCLLGAEAACDTDYANGLSRCDRAAGLLCINGTCQVASSPPPGPSPLEPTPGSAATPTSDAASASGCAGSNSSSVSLGGGTALLLLTIRRRRTTR